MTLYNSLKFWKLIKVEVVVEAIMPFAKCIYNYIYFPCLITTNYTHVALPKPIDSIQLWLCPIFIIPSS